MDTRKGATLLDILKINEILSEHEPDRMILQSFDIRDSILTIAFFCDDSPKEFEVFLLVFKNAWLFHLNSVIPGPLFFKKADEQEREQLIPVCSYDPLELTGEEDAYTVFSIVDGNGAQTDFYVVADEITKAEWVKNEDCLWVW